MDKYSISVDGPPEGSYVKDILYGNISIINKILDLGAFYGHPTLSIVLGSDGGTLNLRVVDKEGKVIPDCDILIVPASATPEPEFAAESMLGQTDQSGSYTSEKLAPGKYKVFATDHAFDRTPEMTEELFKIRDSASDVDVAPNGTTQFSIVR